MKICALTTLLLLLFPVVSMPADITAHSLTLSFSRNEGICMEVAAYLSEDKACRPFDVKRCSWEENYSILVRGTKSRVFEEIATNQYGYTQVYRSIGSSLSGFSIVYVQKFQGDKNPRLVETWKVKAGDLDNVLNLPPGPTPYQQWIKMKPLPPRETNAVEFASLLKQGEKLSDEWSPVIEIDGVPYIIERECSGLWVYGGYYACNKVIKLTIMKLFKDIKAVPYCQFVKSKINR